VQDKERPGCGLALPLQLFLHRTLVAKSYQREIFNPEPGAAHLFCSFLPSIQPNAR
jgi:hypothetical protein